jgi:hypothetical protein
MRETAGKEGINTAFIGKSLEDVIEAFEKFDPS